MDNEQQILSKQFDKELKCELGDRFWGIVSVGYDFSYIHIDARYSTSDLKKLAILLEKYQKLWNKQNSTGVTGECCGAELIYLHGKPSSEVPPRPPGPIVFCPICNTKSYVF